MNKSLRLLAALWVNNLFEVWPQFIDWIESFTQPLNDSNIVVFQVVQVAGVTVAFSLTTLKYKCEW